MIRLRAMFSGLPQGTMLLLLLFVALVSVSTFSSSLEPLVAAQDCATDWGRAIDALKDGATSYSGSCAEFGGFQPGNEVPQDFLRIRDDWERQAGEEYVILTDDLWGTAGRSLGGLPLILFSIIAPALMAGSLMGSGTAAWQVSNGWSRMLWIRSLLTLNAIAVSGAYLVLTVSFVLATSARIGQIGLDAPSVGLGWTVLTPLPGLLFYSMYGLGFGLVVARAESAVLGALAILTGEFVVSSTISNFPILPASLHQVTLGNSERVEEAIATAGLAVAAILLAGIVWTYFVFNRDLPDRPR